MAFRFEWDSEKAAANLGKHGVSFEEASTAFGDPLGWIAADPRHSHGEERLVLLGLACRGRLLALMFTERGPAVVVRRIGARPATRRERNDHAEGQRWRYRSPKAAHGRGGSRGSGRKSGRATARGSAAAADAMDADEILPEYDFSRGERNRYVARYTDGTNVVLLDPDVAARFPDAASVNRARRAVADLADGTPPKPRSRRCTA